MVKLHVPTICDAGTYVLLTVNPHMTSAKASRAVTSADLTGCTDLKQQHAACCRLSQDAHNRSLTTAKPGTTLPPSTFSFSIHSRPSQPSVKLSSTRGIAGRPGPTMGKLLPRQATTCLLSELSKRQDFAHLLAAVILGTEVVLLPITKLYYY